MRARWHGAQGAVRVTWKLAVAGDGTDGEPVATLATAFFKPFRLGAAYDRG